MAFTPSTAATITAIKFYKGTGNTGTHTGSLWSSTGTLLGAVTFTSESATGWQTGHAGHAGRGDRRDDVRRVVLRAERGLLRHRQLLRDAVDQGPLTAPATNNGLYRYGTGGQAPTSSWNASNYFVDVVLRYATP